MPLKIAVNDQTKETAVLVDGAWVKADQIAKNDKDGTMSYLVGGKWMTDTPETPAKRVLHAAGNVISTAVKQGAGVNEAAAQLASGAGASLVGGLAGVAQGAWNLGAEALGAEPGMPAADRVRQVQEKMTYQPGTKFGQKMAGGAGEAMSYLSSKPGEFVGEHGRQLAEKLGASPEVSAAVGAAANTATQVVPQALLAKGAGMAVRLARTSGAAGASVGGATGAGTTGAAQGAANAATAAARAQSYVASLGLDWDRLNSQFQAKLTEIAKDAEGLGRLSDAAIKRQGLLAEVGIDRASRGQLTRDATERGHEIAIRGTSVGKPLKDLDQEQSSILLKNVDDLRKKITAEQLPSGSKARGDLPVGRSVQDKALRAKAQASENRYNALYRKARKTDPDATTPSDPFFDMLEKNPAVQHLSWVKSFLQKGKVAKKAVDAEGNETIERRPLSIAELQDLRTRANSIISTNGPDTHWAIDVKRSIDQIMDQTSATAAPAWKDAIAAFKRHKKEFADQGAVRGLVEERPHSSDRRVATEETAKKTVFGPLEDLQKVKRSLLTGGQDTAVRSAGKIAWRDLKGWTLDYIRSSMTKGPKGEAEAVSGAGSAVGEGHVTWDGLKKALDNISDENLDEIFGQSVRKQLRRYQDAAEILYTTAPERIRGSPTFEKVIKFLDRVGGATGMVGGKVLTDPVAAGVKGVQKIHEFGKGRRDVNAAMTTPLDEQLSRTRRDVRRSQNLSNVKRFGKATAPVAPAAEARPEQ